MCLSLMSRVLQYCRHGPTCAANKKHFAALKAREQQEKKCQPCGKGAGKQQKQKVIFVPPACTHGMREQHVILATGAILPMWKNMLVSQRN